MPTIFSHAAIGFAASRLFQGSPENNRRVMIAAIFAAGLPDADALFIEVIAYGHPFGHRGLTHSLFFAVVIGIAIAWVFTRSEWSSKESFSPLALFFTAVTASHGFFDAMTSGGLGVAFFAPFDNTRYFLPWRPIPVSPLSLGAFLTPRGWRVIGWELALIWPFVVAAALWNRRAMWRMIAAAIGVAAGIAMWGWAWFERR
jgi:inner membrane protein